jgi:3-oxoacyl-[acyl-carrier protein] reductase
MNPANSEFAATMKGLMAIGRYGKDEEIAGFVSYLAGPEAAYITGASLTIDGGFSAGAEVREGPAACGRPVYSCI